MRKVLLVFALIINLILISASVQLLCVEKGQKVEFSKCNSQIRDRVCNSDSGCQYCVNYRNGVYCPTNINECNNAGATCTTPVSSSVDEDIAINSDDGDNQNSNQNNTQTNSNSGTTGDSGINTDRQTNKKQDNVNDLFLDNEKKLREVEQNEQNKDRRKDI